MNQSKLILNRINEMNLEFEHEFELDDNGDGFLRRSNSDHEHKVISFEVLPCTDDGHIHEIPLPQGWSKYSDDEGEI